MIRPVILLYLLGASICSKADEFPWVRQILFQDSITWIGTNDGLYKIIENRKGAIRCTKELENASEIYIDTKNTIWVVDFGNGLYYNRENKWELLQDDTVKYISNIYEFDSKLYILASVKNEMRYLWRSNGQWNQVTTFNPPHQKGKERAYGLVVNQSGVYSGNTYFDDLKRSYIDNFYRFHSGKWTILKEGVKDFYFDKKSGTWIFFYGMYSNKIEINANVVEIPRGELIQDYNVDQNGSPWILTFKGLFYSYKNGQWKKQNNAINSIKELKFWIKNDKEIWVGGYAYVAYYKNDQWIELSFLTPKTHNDGNGDEANAEQGDANQSDSKIHKWGIINDKDGYSNVREAPDSKSKVIAKLLTNMKFRFFESSKTDWWQIETERGTTGYVHKSRIQEL
ncbi:MAG TPA: SH3 domain-containing protein [Chryseosolibacter sp.]